MNASSITPQQVVKNSSSNELRQRVVDYKKDNEYLAKMTAYNQQKAQLIREGISEERIR